MQDFIHLHVHTQYSLLDGQTNIKKLVDKAVADGMRGVAITDHGNMMGIKEFKNYCDKKNGELEAEGKHFKPIIGCEVYVAPRSKEQREGKELDGANYHLILLAKNEKGYHNLIKIVSRAWTDGFYSHPRTDKADLEKYHEGIICCSACLGGEVPKLITAGKIEEAEKTVQWFHNLFGEDYYLELQLHKATVPKANHEAYPLQQNVNTHLREMSRKFGIKTVCTNDVHFLDEENADAHELLICLSTGRDPDDPNLMRYSKQEWFKTREEMNMVFQDDPESLANTIEILDKVEEYSINHPPIMPNFAIPEEFGTEAEYRQRLTEKDLFDEFTQDEHGNVVMSQEDAEKKIKKLGGYDKLYRIKLEADYLKKLTFEGARVKYGDPIPDSVLEQLVFELHVMKTMGFPGYFLIVQDFINAARNQLGVSVGPGRGSAAGSAVAYCLGITLVDPIKYDLLFERFLNPDRISLPDIDVDFDDDGRGRVLQWVTEKYGKEKVAHIITYGTMATKMAIKDVARVLKVPLDISNNLCKAIPDRLPDTPDGKPRKMNLKNVLECVPELQAAAASDNEALRMTIQYARMLEGNVRGTGVHACGTIICRDDITDWVPVSWALDKESGERLLVTQYEGSVIEDTGLIKMDFLGLKTLSIIKEALANIKMSLGLDIDIEKIPIDDPKTFQLYCDGRTIGTFQFESPGMQKYLRELQPSVFEDLIAMNALYRPGPMDYIPDFIDRKLGRKPIEYDIPCMEKYLKDTYGITVYQEQVMLLSRLLANFTRGESDTLRKAMGKKLKDKLDHLKPKFIAGGQANGHDPKVLEKIWADWEKFASYAFNKSHATCYSWVAYQTAYLKANYPSQYMAAVLSRSADITEITKLMDECKAMGINVLGPDVNESVPRFGVNAKGDIRFGMASVKGVGENAVTSIVSERAANGPYKSIFDFVQRVNLTACNRKNIENLALSGAFDCFPEIRREQFLQPCGSKGETFSDILVRYGNKYQTDRNESQFSLFGDMGTAVEIATPVIPDAPEWSVLDKLNKEKDLVGIYISAHPLDDYRVILEHVCTVGMAQMEDRKALLNKDIICGGVVVAVRESRTKTGKPCGFTRIEDFTGSYEIALFGDPWMTWRNRMIVGNFLFIKGQCIQNRYMPDRIDFVINSIDLLQDVKETAIHSLKIVMPLSELDETFVSDIDTLTLEPGNVTLKFEFFEYGKDDRVSVASASRKINVTGKLVDYLKEKETIQLLFNQ
ncbi:MAG: DNA polymerase III subunit alpha [Bacteroidaceae bacterium]|nr:DNA polymerase III subunit alpha [Bacteroidaceae bacterium]